MINIEGTRLADNNFISDLIKDVLRDLHAFSGGLFILIKISIM